MKNLNQSIVALSLSVALTLGFTADATAKPVKVFLLAGQSNMVGQADASGLPTSPANLQQPQTDVLFYQGSTLGDLQPKNGEFGPEITFGRTIADALPDQQFGLIKHAVSGSSLETSWNPSSGNAYTNFNTRVSNGLDAIDNYEIVGMLWTQGETDAINGRSTAQYQADLTALITDMRGTYGSDLPFFISQLSNAQTNIPSGKLAEIRTAQANVAALDSNAYLIDTDSFGVNNDNLHFNASGQIALGEAFAQSYLSTVPEPTSLVAMVFGGLVLLRRSRRHRGHECSAS